MSPRAADDKVMVEDVVGAEELGAFLEPLADYHDVGIAITHEDGTAFVERGLSLRDLSWSKSESGVCMAGHGSYWAEVVSTSPFDPVFCIVGTTTGDSAAVYEDLARHIASLVRCYVEQCFELKLKSAQHMLAAEETFDALEQKNARLQEALTKLQELDLLKTNFLATVSHELRTPLTSVIGYSEMLLEELPGPLNDEQRDYVDTVLRKAEQLLQLITGILDASMIESGRLIFAKQSFYVHDIVQEAVDSVVVDADKRNVTLVVHGAETPEMIGDRKRLREAIRHVLSNAIKFSYVGGEVEVRIARSQVPAPKQSEHSTDAIRVAICDHGIGISEEKQAQIFDSFFQVDSSSTREYGGTGLGLALAKRYVEGHHGLIWVDSELGSGSTFSILLPVEPEPPAPGQ